jgi:uncharacterized membrane protein YphA (DoxX/SURF4 family)
MTFLRRAIGVLFVLTGTLKLLAMPGFAAVLAQTGTPLPHVFAIAVPLLEIGGGAALLTNRFARPIAAILAINMIFAIALVGIPGARGERFRAGEYTIGGEAWRMPLELGLLLGLIIIAARGVKSNE